MRVLLVEDDDAIAEPLISGLGRHGFQVSWARTGAEALAAAPHDVVLLDLGLPDMDGIDICRRLRASSTVPIIVVTARSEEVDRVLGLELGADDYVVKPFGFRELVARIRAVTRRARPTTSPLEGPQRVGRLELDRRQRQVRLDEAEVTLTAKEFDLLALLAEDPGAVFAREQILEQVWDPHWFGPTKTLDVHVASLRKKLGDPGWIETVRGIGFRLVPDDPAAAAQLPVHHRLRAPDHRGPSRGHLRPGRTRPAGRWRRTRRYRAGHPRRGHP